MSAKETGINMRDEKGRFIKGSSGFNRKHTKESKRKMSESSKRRFETEIPYNKGKKYPGRINSGSFKRVDNPSKSALLKRAHDWIRRQSDEPDECWHRHLGNCSKTFQWSNVSNKYKEEISDWQKLCIRHHKKYDLKKYDKWTNQTSFLKGNKAWNKGKHWTEITKQKISQSHKGKHLSPKTEFKKGRKSWNRIEMFNNCLLCNRKIKVCPSIIKEGRGRYCSKKCLYNRKTKEAA